MARKMANVKQPDILSRNTKQKEAIREAIISADRPLSPEEILAAAQKHAASVSIATVYRNIGALVKEEWLLPVEFPGMPPRYEIAGKAHHHHFHCNDCGKVFELEGCAVNFRPRLPKGFRATAHEFFLSGSCAECR
jgi:Fur family ferric uptake transcriptional regulator